jgi:hypothetical protein
MMGTLNVSNSSRMSPWSVCWVEEEDQKPGTGRSGHGSTRQGPTHQVRVSSQTCFWEEERRLVNPEPLGCQVTPRKEQFFAASPGSSQGCGCSLPLGGS